MTLVKPSSRQVSITCLLTLTSLVLAFFLACGGGSSPTEPTPPTPAPAPSCANIAGTWMSRFANDCGDRDQAEVVINQTGCQVTFTLPIGGTFTGTLQPEGDTDLTIDLDSACGGSTVGVLRMPDERTVNVLYGTGDDCCRHGLSQMSR